jgi:diadenosine tetraphosphate (Ap4A) HIT family hydrolase
LTTKETIIGTDRTNKKNDTLQIENLYKKQFQLWPFAEANYKHLQSAVYRDFDWGGMSIKVQFNPGRIRSASAKVDEKSIEQRPCFLCPQNRPEIQLSIDYSLHYSILVNPYPIFPRHLTIAEKRHMPQAIEGRMNDMAGLARDLSGYTLLYNGPQSGASAPDHFHFQAVPRNSMPVEREIHSFEGRMPLRKEKAGSIYYLKNYLRKAFLFTSKDTDWLLRESSEFFKVLHELHPENEEPKMNLLLWFENETGHLVVFPRRQHRPKEFFETGEKQLVVSPGIIDMGGLLIIARKEDFGKLNKERIAGIYEQVSMADEEEKLLLKQLV